MYINALYFLVISAGGIFGATALNKKYEEMLPISILSTILVSYVFGLLGQMRLGAYAVFVLAVALYLGSIYLNISKKSWRNTFRHLLTPGFVVTVILYVILNVANRNKLAYSWDEFSHWADVVKMMATQNQFASDPMSGSLFKSYVPAMALFQYNFQVLGQMLVRGFEFSEWRLYLSYQLATYSLLVYFLKDLNWKKPHLVSASAIAIFLIPSAFYSFFDVIYIDPFLGIIAGFTFAQAVLFNPKNKVSVTTLLLSLSTLVLTKDAGLFIALFVCLYLVISLYSRKEFEYNKWISAVVLIVCVVLPKISWDLHLKNHSVAKIFGQSIDITQLLRSIFSGDATDYRWVTFNNFWKAMSEKKVIIGDTNIQTSYMLLIALLLIGIYIMSKWVARRWDLGERFRRVTTYSIAMFSGAYTLGMCGMYMFKFSEYEAVRLASFSRYMNILCSMLLIVFAVLLLQVIIDSNWRTWKYSAVIVMALILPTAPIQSFLSGTYVRNSIAVRAPYSKAADEVLHIIGNEPKKIYLISQEDTGFDYWVLKYSLRPHYVNTGFTWSVGKPFYDGDIWTMKTEPEEWIDTVMSDFEYIYIYKLNDYFANNYQEFFDDSSVAATTLYRVDKNMRSLVKVGRDQ